MALKEATAKKVFAAYKPAYTTSYLDLREKKSPWEAGLKIMDGVLLKK